MAATVPGSIGAMRQAQLHAFKWPLRWPWPMPALAAWVLAWAAHLGLQGAGVAAWACMAAGLLPGLWWQRLQATLARRLMVALGYPLSVLALGLQGQPWAWGAAAAVLALAYPHRTWRDAPLYPTPSLALQSLPAHLPLRAGARVLDAGCGLGHGLRALRRACPQAQLQGVEFSRPLALLARLSCPKAQIHRGDMWALPWGDYHVVYLFQRPESMARAWAKACAEMPPGSWLLSLEFEVPGQRPQAQWCDVPGKPVHAYQVGAAPMRRAPKV